MVDWSPGDVGRKGADVVRWSRCDEEPDEKGGARVANFDGACELRRKKLKL